MELDRESRLRKAIRTSFTKVSNQLKLLIENANPDKRAIQVLFIVFEKKFDELKAQDEKIMRLLLEAENADIEAEVESTDNYQMKFTDLQVGVMLILNSVVTDNLETGSVQQGATSGSVQQGATRKFKLPKLEFRKFGDDVKDWLPFWSQFQKIDKDEGIAVEDKLQYLRQAMMEGSRAREIVESFPQTGENYCKALDSLKARFGRDDFLVEVYIRELLKLVISVHQYKEHFSFSSLYDKLESHLRALETLGVNADKCASMLFPLVESCFPEDFLKAWHRSSTFSLGEPKERLKKLMEFLKLEVEGEERISLAMAGFGLGNTEKKPINRKKCAKEEVPTATGLLSTSTVDDKQSVCVFCEGKHLSSDCFSARKLTLSEKRERLKEKGCCFGCLRSGHPVRRCRTNLRCIVCGKRHVTLMCSELKHETSPGQRLTVDKKQSANNEVTMTTLNKNPKVFLQTLRVKMRSENKERIVRALLDTGSQKSYVSKDIAKDMGYEPLRQETVIHSLFGGVNTEQEKHNVYRIRVANLNGKFACNFEALDHTIICARIPNITKGPWTEELAKKRILLTDVENTSENIDILIGADVAGKLLTGRREVLSCGLVAIETYLGWTILGKVPQEEVTDSSIATMVSTFFVKEADLSDLWKLDLIGIRDPIEQKSKLEKELETKQHFLDTVQFNEQGRYEVHLPWSEDHPPIPDNLNLARKRLLSTTRKLLSNNLYEEYDQVFREWLSEGIIEEVPTNEIDSYGHYLPHRPVIKENSTTRIRPVFDASAKVPDHVSLNQCIECGPNLIEQLPDILLRFREKKLGITADIRKAFLQISMYKEDRDFLRFLWWENVATEKEKVFRHTRVVFGVTCSPFLLEAVIEYHIMRSSEEASPWTDRLLKSFYVDNLVTSIDSENDLQNFIESTKQLMLQGGFDLRGWLHSEQELKSEGEDFPVLGLLWNSHTDVLKINMNWLNSVEVDVISKRTVLSVAQKTFDPIGLVSPVMLYAKLILQKTWRLKISWDEEITTELKTEFSEWFKELHLLDEVAIPRWIRLQPKCLEHCSIHSFCDASKDAYACVVYLRVETNTQAVISLLAAKTRIAPMKGCTIPRLELLAALVGARLTKSVLQAFGWNEVKCYYWSDSTTVLAWISRNENWSVFVRNRVQEIRTLSNPSSWGHISGVSNPADLLSRSCKASYFLKVRWWEGPSWMCRPMEEWPGTNLAARVWDEDEIQHEKLKTSCNLFNTDFEKKDWYYRHFSKYHQIVRLVGWLLRFFRNCLNLDGTKKNGELTAEEYCEAEKKVIWMIQREAFVDEEDEKFKTLDAYKDEQGLIRLKTKIVYRVDKEDFRKPMILPSSHEVVDRLIMSQHCNNSHAGVQILLNILRERYWILNGRKTVRRVISKCVVCKRFNSKRLDPATAPLPENRVRDASVFEISGVDMAGPLYLKGNQKVWILIFTCAVYRAVHLELVTAVSTETFLLALRRFIARRGRCSVIYCDNGTNFVGAANLLRSLNWNRILDHGSVNSIVWKFNPPSAAWWGGFFERLIRILKDLLKRVLGRACLTYEEMLTVLCDCEAIINSRPLTYLSESGSDLVPLTPAMFLQDIQEGGVPDLNAIDHQSLNRRVRYRLSLQDNLRKRFRSEYLGQLVQRSSVKKNCHSVAVGDVVLVGSDNLKPIYWPMGIVLKTIPGKDGIVRLARIRTSHSELLRPVQRLHPLEVKATDLIGCENDRISCHEADNPKTEVNPPTETCMTTTKRNVKQIVTKYGRSVKLPDRLQL